MQCPYAGFSFLRYFPRVHIAPTILHGLCSKLSELVYPRAALVTPVSVELYRPHLADVGSRHGTRFCVCIWVFIFEQTSSQRQPASAKPTFTPSPYGLHSLHDTVDTPYQPKTVLGTTRILAEQPPALCERTHTTLHQEKQRSSCMLSFASTFSSFPRSRRTLTAAVTIFSPHCVPRFPHIQEKTVRWQSRLLFSPKYFPQ